MIALELIKTYPHSGLYISDMDQSYVENYMWVEIEHWDFLKEISVNVLGLSSKWN